MFQINLRLALLKEGFKVMTYEGNMADEREFDLEAANTRLEIFMEMISGKKKNRVTLKVD